MEDGTDSGYGEEGFPEFVVKVSHEAKLRELLRNLTSVELKLCSDGSKEFIKLLRDDSGGELLREYMQTSSKCSELLQAWKLREGKPGLSSVLSLISAILSHPDGRYKPSDVERLAISRALDKLARLIVDEKFGELYKELNSKEAKRQNAALSLLGSIVRRGSGLASDVVKSFDFKLPILPRLAEWKQKRFDVKRKHSTRKSFVAFAMSFLEVGKPGLLRWVLQQKEMYSGVLRGLGNDDEETVVYVLSTLRDRILIPESLVPPGLRSVLFGSVALDQLIIVSGRKNGGIAAEMAYNVLLMVCTDPSNGLMPDLNKHPSPLKGNPKRLLGLMKKLKAIEIDYHRELLLAIVKGRLSLGSAYLDEFPYNLEDHASPTWFNAVSLAADVVSSVGTGLSFSSIDSQLQGLPSFNSPNVQSIIKCVGPRSFTRLVINKGLLHSDSLVKHGTLRLVWEALELLDSFIAILETSYCSNSEIMHKWASLRRDVQNEARFLLPDPQVLLSLLSSLSSHYRPLNSSSKRAADSDILLEHHVKGSKKLKTSDVSEDINILVSGISSSPDIAFSDNDGGVPGTNDVDGSEYEGDQVKVITGIWGLRQCSEQGVAAEDEETCFYSKLLDALKSYHRTMPTALEGSFDFFKILPKNILELPTMLQRSLLSVLIEHVGALSKCENPIRTQPQMYKHLRPFIDLMMYSPISNIREQAYILAQAAMLSTGAFDRNQREIDSWFLFIPSYGIGNCFVEGNAVEVFQNLSAAVVSFLCDAVSTTGNNLFKYLDLLRKCSGDVSPDFSPLVICVMEKCLRLLTSESGTFTLAEKSLISLYVCNTLRYLLQSQVEAGLLSSLIDRLLSERVEDHQTGDNVFGDFCEWWSLKNLLQFLRSISDEQTCEISSIVREGVPSGNSFMDTLNEVKKFIRSGHDTELVGVTTAFSFSMLCTTSSEIVQNLPLVVSISKNLFGAPFSLLVSILFSEPCLLNDMYNLWPEMFIDGVELVLDMSHGDEREEETKINIDINSVESASVGFAFFLKWAPFCVLFPAIVHIDGLLPLELSKLQNLLLAKVSEGTTNQLVSSFHHVLFWIYRLQLSYKIEQLDKLEKLSEMCFIVIERILVQLFAENTDSGCSINVSASLSSQYVQEMAEILFNHPLVTVLLESPSYDKKELTGANFEGSLENFLHIARRGFHKIDLYILNLLRTTSEHLLSFFTGRKSPSGINSVNEQIAKAFKTMLHKLFQVLKARFEQSIKTEDLASLIPTLYALHSLAYFICPFVLLELVNWLFSRIDLINSMVGVSIKRSILSIGLHIAGCAFDMLSAYLQQPNVEQMPFILFWNTEEKRFDAALYETVYVKVFEIATSLELDVADLCLLKIVNVANLHKVIQNQHLPFSMAVLRVIGNTPITLLSHCIHRISKIRAELLFLITRISPLHLSVFGNLFSEMMNGSFLPKGNVVQETHNCSFSNEDFIMLLPTALSYLNSAPLKFGGHFYHSFRSIPCFYWRILMCYFSNWKRDVSGKIFEVEFSEVLPSSIKELLDLFSGSLLGKALFMLRNHLALSGNSVKHKKRLKLFDSVCPYDSAHNHLLDCDVGQIDVHSLKQSLSFINRMVAKLFLCRMLLFPEDNQVQPLLKGEKDEQQEKGEGDMEEILALIGSSEVNLSRTRFLNLLVASWQLIVKKFPTHAQNCEKPEVTKESLFRLLEIFILRTILKLTAKMHNCLIKLPTLPFVEELVKLSLLHRFQDPVTLRIIRSILAPLSEGKFSHNLVQLLLAHSQFATTVHPVSKLSDCSHLGMIFRPMSSILRSVVISCANPRVQDNNLQKPEQYMKKLEVIKLLRALFRIKTQHYSFNSEEDIGINMKELLFLLLCSYGATVSEVDLEIYNLMNEIVAIDGSNSGGFTEFDYIWGDAAIKIRKECEQEQGVYSHNTDDLETVKECRRIQLRENLPIDPKLCATTVLYFPYGRTVHEGTSRELQVEDSEHLFEEHFTNIEKVQTYDPIFLLRFSIHSLSMGYIEPMEFASLGLLAVTFVSISSPDDDTRKLGYEALGKFKSRLEKCQKRKDLMRLRLLLTYLQNGIEDPWQRIPSITAIFLAEASFLLLDPSHDHYSTISKLLMRSPSVNMKSIPLFPELFWSSSVSFKTDRLWILRLLYAGLNLEDDVQIYIRNSIFEMLLSFFASPLSDDESKELILQVVKKSIKLHKKVRYLVEHCNLIPWLSSLLSFDYLEQYQEQKSLLPTQLMVILEVVNDVILSRDTIEWLQKSALEQLTELSSHLYKLLVGGIELIKEKIPLVISILQILTSTLKISQKRKVYQPHFTLSVEGLFRLFKAIDESCKGRYNPTAEFGLKTVLMSTPSVAILCMDPEKFLKFVTWTASTALQSDKVLQLDESYHHFTVYFEEKESEDSLVSKLLRWLTASAILGLVSWNDLNSSCSFERSNHGTLQSLLEQEEKRCPKGQAEFGCKETLAATILYLQQLLGMHCRVLPSVVSALCLALFSCPSHAESDFLLGYGRTLKSLCSRVRCPAEANPAWRWSFYQPWKDLSSKPTDLEKMDELHACQSLLIIISNVLGRNSLYSQFLSHQDVVNSGVYEWERSIVKSE